MEAIMQISQIPAGNESSDVLYGLQALQDCKHIADAAGNRWH